MIIFLIFYCVASKILFFCIESFIWIYPEEKEAKLVLTTVDSSTFPTLLPVTGLTATLNRSRSPEDEMF